MMKVPTNTLYMYRHNTHIHTTIRSKHVIQVQSVRAKWAKYYNILLSTRSQPKQSLRFLRDTHMLTSIYTVPSTETLSSSMKGKKIDIVFLNHEQYL